MINQAKIPQTLQQYHTRFIFTCEKRFVLKDKLDSRKIHQPKISKFFQTIDFTAKSSFASGCLNLILKEFNRNKTSLLKLKIILKKTENTQNSRDVQREIGFRYISRFAQFSKRCKYLEHFDPSFMSRHIQVLNAINWMPFLNSLKLNLEFDDQRKLILSINSENLLKQFQYSDFLRAKLKPLKFFRRFYIKQVSPKGMWDQQILNKLLTDHKHTLTFLKIQMVEQMLESKEFDQEINQLSSILCENEFPNLQNFVLKYAKDLRFYLQGQKGFVKYLPHILSRFLIDSPKVRYEQTQIPEIKKMITSFGIKSLDDYPYQKCKDILELVYFNRISLPSKLYNDLYKSYKMDLNKDNNQIPLNLELKGAHQNIKEGFPIHKFSNLRILKLSLQCEKYEEHYKLAFLGLGLLKLEKLNIKFYRIQSGLGECIEGIVKGVQLQKSLKVFALSIPMYHNNDHLEPLQQILKLGALQQFEFDQYQGYIPKDFGINFVKAIKKLKQLRKIYLNFPGLALENIYPTLKSMKYLEEIRV